MHGNPNQILSALILILSPGYKHYAVVTPSIYDLTLTELQELISSWGQPSYRATQIWEGIYRHLWSKPEQFTILPKKVLEILFQSFSLPVAGNDLSLIRPVQILKSSDGETVKTLFNLPDNHAIEAVLMRYAKRRTLCISTQAGCAMGCVFCATGQMGFKRHLNSGEIIQQVLYYSRQLASLGEQVTNIVVMGMGEPFHNYNATMDAIDRLNHPGGYNFSARRFTISTVGLIPEIQRFTREHRQINLAVSLHAADDVLRTSLLPINKKYPLDDLLAACLVYVRETHRRISFEWALIHEINDSFVHARQLADRLQPFIINQAALCHVNIILLNPTTNYAGHATTRQKAREFAAELEDSDIPCTIRLRRGIDIQAGCGQLAIRNL
jgi:23S rRNA (adenine2503-C2)-methyltransferase